MAHSSNIIYMVQKQWARPIWSNGEKAPWHIAKW
jgi:hypothetical protein